MTRMRRMPLTKLILAMVWFGSTVSSLESDTGNHLDSHSFGKALGNDLSEVLESYSALGKNASSVAHSRQARQLIDFPDSAVMEFYFKLVVPYWTYGSTKTKGDYRFEVSYELPNHLRRRRSITTERSNVYGMLSDFLSKAGLDGESCILRAVCEIAESPLDEYGLFGEFINLIFAPGFNADEIGHRDQIQAEDYGRSFGNCWSAFPDCPVSMRQLLYEFFMGNSETIMGNQV